MNLKEQAEAFLAKEGGSPNMLRHKPEAIWLMSNFADDAVTDYKARLLERLEAMKLRLPYRGALHAVLTDSTTLSEVIKIVEEL